MARSGLAVGLVRGHRRPRDLPEDRVAQALEAASVRRPLAGVEQEPLVEPAPFGVVAEIERPVLPDHGVDRPHAGDVVAPAGRPAANRNDEETRLVQAFQGAIGLRRQPAAAGQGVVDVGEHAADGAAGLDAEGLDRLHIPLAGVRSA